MSSAAKQRSRKTPRRRGNRIARQCRIQTAADFRFSIEPQSVFAIENQKWIMENKESSELRDFAARPVSHCSFSVTRFTPVQSQPSFANPQGLRLRVISINRRNACVRDAIFVRMRQARTYRLRMVWLGILSLTSAACGAAHDFGLDRGVGHDDKNFLGCFVRCHDVDHERC
jgi:hypothetical protein